MPQAPPRRHGLRAALWRRAEKGVGQVFQPGESHIGTSDIEALSETLHSLVRLEGQQQIRILDVAATVNVHETKVLVSQGKLMVITIFLDLISRCPVVVGPQRGLST